MKNKKKLIFGGYPEILKNCGENHKNESNYFYSENGGVVGFIPSGFKGQVAGVTFRFEDKKNKKNIYVTISTCFLRTIVNLIKNQKTKTQMKKRIGDWEKNPYFIN